ncbi:RNA polymerase recycling motor HelD [Desulfosporosinus nitroreducens]|uniref:RNA polymerase recycling motor HelD n=1 Tax=Desulfosporosinus nitroreducens TaxID=2018668 RepID=UPI00207C9CCD|nr:RNA polymerase recycling motor HelD [Desulfosporosinus nitroreducens]MCO1603080.1 UvrD-helicase domain-containing protein [Desulfosporosinus nitroreducens]
MSSHHHEFDQEAKRLASTITYMKKMINLIVENRQGQREEIRQAFIDLDYLDSSQSYISILVTSQLLEYGEQHFYQLNQGLAKPYFSRIDFKQEGSPDFKRYYIGKLSLLTQEDQEPLILDWRSPIASIYYEGRLGAVDYQSPTGTIQGELGLKRQYTIENGQLLEIRDIDITTNDAFLQASLEASADNRLKDIATSIQAEQNRVIRADIAPLIVQGVAGSGKTTIAIHRMAYLIYTYEDRFIPENFIILGPNRLFLNYISEALPELGAERVTQTTLIDFMLELIGKTAKIKLVPPEQKLFQLLEENNQSSLNSSYIIGASEFKGSLQFKDVLDHYVERLQETFVPKVDFKLGDYVILEAEDIQRVFLEEYSFLPLQKRIEMVKKVLTNKLKAAKEPALKLVEEEFNRQIQEVRSSSTFDEEVRREKGIALVDSRNETLTKLTNSAKTVVKKYLALFPKIDLLDHYKRIIADPDVFLDTGAKGLDRATLEYLCSSSAELIAQNKLELEDLAPLVYLKQLLFGYEEKFDISHVFIDEAQDLSIFQLYTLRKVLKTDMFTIFGDLAQGIHAYRGIKSWDQVRQEVFPALDCNYLTLEQSYRTTIEIMEYANQVIKKVKATDILLAKPVIRHGVPPDVLAFKSVKDMVHAIENLLEIQLAGGYKSIALIGKTLKECQLLKKNLNIPCEILHGDETLYEGQVLIVPSYVSKGLEFDVVFIFNIHEHYSDEDLDLKLLYVAMTRARHRLFRMSISKSGKFPA